MSVVMPVGDDKDLDLAAGSDGSERVRGFGSGKVAVMNDSASKSSPPMISMASRSPSDGGSRSLDTDLVLLDHGQVDGRRLARCSSTTTVPLDRHPDGLSKGCLVGDAVEDDVGTFPEFASDYSGQVVNSGVDHSVGAQCQSQLTFGSQGVGAHDLGRPGTASSNQSQQPDGARPEDDHLLANEVAGQPHRANWRRQGLDECRLVVGEVLRDLCSRAAGTEKTSAIPPSRYPQPKNCRFSQRFSILCRHGLQ